MLVPGLPRARPAPARRERLDHEAQHDAAARRERGAHDGVSHGARYFFGASSAGGVGGGGGGVVAGGDIVDEVLDESDGGVGVLGVDGVIGALEVAGGGGGGGGGELLQPARSAPVPSMAIKAIVVLMSIPCWVRTTPRPQCDGTPAA